MTSNQDGLWEKLTTSGHKGFLERLMTSGHKGLLEFSFFFTYSPLTVEGNHSVVMLFVPFFKLGSDSKFDPSKDLSSCAAASPCSSLSRAASMFVFS